MRVNQSRERIILGITGMHCTSCASNIEDALKKVSGVLRTQVNFALEKAYIEFEPWKLEVKDLIEAIEKSGYKAFMPEASFDKEKELRDKEVKSLKNKFIVSIILSRSLQINGSPPIILIINMPTSSAWSAST